MKSDRFIIGIDISQGVSSFIFSRIRYKLIVA